MTRNWKFIIPIGLIVIIGVALLYSRYSPKPTPIEIPAGPEVETETPSVPEIPETEEPIVPSPETEEPIVPSEVKIDDEVNALISAFGAEQSDLTDEESDASLITADSQALSDLGQSYDEKEF